MQDTLHEPEVQEEVLEEAQEPDAGEIEQAIEEQITGDEVPPTEAEVEALVENVTSLEWLVDLQYTISKEGVSQSDIHTLNQIREKALQRGFDLNPCASLEHYSTGGFTQDRSFLNLNVSQEGIGQTILELIKEWIKRFKEWVIKAIRYAKNRQHMDAKVKAKLDRVLGNLDEIREASIKWRAMSPGVRDHGDEFQANAEEAAKNPKLKRCAVTLGFFGHTFYWTDLKELQIKARRQVTGLEKAIDEFKQFVKGSIDTPNTNEHVLAGFKEVNESAQRMLMDDPNPNYLTNELTVEVFEAPIMKMQRMYIGYEFLIDGYTQASDFLRELNSVRATIDQDHQSAHITGVIQVINDCYLEMEKLINFFVEARKIQIAAVNAYYQYWNKAFTIAFNDMMPNKLVPDLVKKQAMKTKDSINSSLRSAGVVF